MKHTASRKVEEIINMLRRALGLECGCIGILPETERPFKALFELSARIFLQKNPLSAFASSARTA